MGHGLTLPGWREAHGLGERGQHRLFRQPEAQPSAQGSGGERKGSGLCTPVRPCPLPPPLPPSVSPSSTPGRTPPQNRNHLWSWKGPETSHGPT